VDSMKMHLLLFLLIGSVGINLIEAADSTYVISINSYFKVAFPSYGYIYGNFTGEWDATAKTAKINFHQFEKLFSNSLEIGITYKATSDGTSASTLCAKKDPPNVECTATFTATLTGPDTLIIYAKDTSKSETENIIEIPYNANGFDPPSCVPKKLSGGSVDSQCICPSSKNIGTECKDLYPRTCLQMIPPGDNMPGYSIPAIRLPTTLSALNLNNQDYLYVYRESDDVKKYYTITYKVATGTNPSSSESFYMNIKIGQNTPADSSQYTKSLITNRDLSTVTVFSNAYCTNEAETSTTRCMCCDQSSGKQPAKECLKVEATTTTTTTTTSSTTTTTTAIPDTTTTTTTTTTDTSNAVNQAVNFSMILCFLVVIYFF